MKELYREALKRKITLPAIYNNEYIILVGNFKNTYEIEDIYFLEDNNYIGIYNGGFGVDLSEKSKLKNCYLPSSRKFVYIGDESFKYCSSLECIDITGNHKLPDSVEFIGRAAFSGNFNGKHLKVNIKELPSALTTLGNNCFYCGGDNIEITFIPPNVSQIPQWCFAYCPNVNISNFGSENLGTGLQLISTGALYDSGKLVTSIKLLPSITTLATGNFGAFAGYAPNLISFESAKTADQIVDLDGNVLKDFVEAGVKATAIIAEMGV